MKRKSHQKRRKDRREQNKVILSPTNPANLSWTEIFKRYNKGSNQTIVGKIIV